MDVIASQRVKHGASKEDTKTKADMNSMKTIYENNIRFRFTILTNSRERQNQIDVAASNSLFTRNAFQLCE
jgi:hypothetical protein